jgi:predicted alpha/beta-hydrolase family hydrolase
MNRAAPAVVKTRSTRLANVAGGVLRGGLCSTRQWRSGSMANPVTLTIDGGQQVSGLLLAPPDARACYVLAHGAGAGMAHPFMATVATGLGTRGIATLRYQFPYMEHGSRRPDVPRVAHATVRAAVDEAARQLPGLPLFAGGKSFGGRMTSQAQAGSPLPGVHGLVFLGFPLHPAGKPSDERAAHLSEVGVPMLFLRGTRDELADTGLLRSLVDRLGSGATLQLIPDADHSFHVPARSGRKDAEVMSEMLDVVAAWIAHRLAIP